MRTLVLAVAIVMGAPPAARAQLLVETHAGRWPGDNIEARDAWLNYTESISVATTAGGQTRMFLSENHGFGLRMVSDGVISTLAGAEWTFAVAANAGGTTLWYSTGDRLWQRDADPFSQAILVAGGGSVAAGETPRSRVRLGFVEAMAYDDLRATLFALDGGDLIRVQNGLTSRLALPGSYASLDVDAEGRVYLLSADDLTVVHRFDPASGSFTKHATFARPVHPMALDATTGCVYGRGQLRILEACGDTTTVAVDLPALGLSNDNVRIDVDRSGALHVFCLAGVFRVDSSSGALSWLVGGPLRDVSPPDDVKLLSPLAVCSDATTLYVPDSYTRTLTCIDRTTGAARICAGNLFADFFGFRDGPARDATFDQLNSCATGRAGVYLGEGYNSTVRLFHREEHDGTTTELVRTVVGVPEGMSLRVVPDGTPALQAVLSSDQGFLRPIVESPITGELFVSDPAHQVIYAVSPGGDGRVDGDADELVRRVAGRVAHDGTGVYECGADDIPARDSGLAWPTNAVFGDDGSLYFSDTDCGRIRKIAAIGGRITSASLISTVAGPRLANPHRSGRPDHKEFGWRQFADGAGDAARFAWPIGIARREGALFVADLGNHRIREIDLATGMTTTIAGNGASLLSIDGQGGDPLDDYRSGVAALSASVPLPTGVHVDDAGALLFVDDHQVVRRLR